MGGVMYVTRSLSKELCFLQMSGAGVIYNHSWGISVMSFRFGVIFLRFIPVELRTGNFTNDE